MEMVGKAACLVLLCMVVVAPHAEALNCNQVSGGLAPCLNYLRNGGAVPVACCSGVKNLANSARTTPDRKAACTCLKSLAGALKIGPTYAAGLPGKCGVNIPYKISPATDCSKVH